MNLYVAIGWLACIATSIGLGISLWRDRSLIIRPSFFVLLCFHLMIQWAATIYAEYLYDFLPEPWEFAALTQGFPLTGLAVSLALGRRSQRAIWQRLVHPRTAPAGYRNQVSLALAIGIAVVAVYYVAAVPINQTGLYAILLDPTESAMAREESLKLLDDPLLKYAFCFMASAFAPMLAVLLAEQVTESLKPFRPARMLAGLVGVLAVLLVVSPTGARGYPATIVLAVLLSRMLRMGLPINPPLVLSAALAVLALPTALSLLREGHTLDLASCLAMLQEGIFRRTLYVPMETGAWYAHYAQTAGLIGIRGIPKLAALFGYTPLDVPNLLGLLYGINPIESVCANTCYVFSSYSYFGLLSVPVSLIGLWLLDAALWLYDKINDYLLLPCITAICSSSIAFVSTDYTKVFLSNGWAVILILALVLDRLPWAKRLSLREAGEAEPRPDVRPAAWNRGRRARGEMGVALQQQRFGG